MSANQISSHLIDEVAYKNIRTMVKTTILTGKQKIKISELDQNIQMLGIQSNSGYSFADSRALVKNAYEYYTQKGKNKLAGNIKQKFTDNNGNSIIP